MTTQPRSPTGRRITGGMAYAVAICIVLLSGCNVGPRYMVPAVPAPPAFKESSPAAYSSAPPGAWQPALPQDAALKGKWWEMLNEPELNALEEQLNINNQNIAQYFQNFMAARAQVSEARAGFFPTATADPTVTRSGGGGAGATTSGTTGVSSASRGGTFNDFALPFDVSWEPDLWGRVRNTVREYQYAAQVSAAVMGFVDEPHRKRGVAGRRAGRRHDATGLIQPVEDLAEQVQKGEINFDRCIATPDMMGVVGRLGKVLGPRGLMPNPKTGTVTEDTAKAVGEVKAGRVEFKLDKNGNVAVPLGKFSFAENQLVENGTAIIEAVVRRLSRPDAVDLLRPPIDPVDATALREERRVLEDKLVQLGKDFATAPPEFTQAALADINGRLGEISDLLTDPGKARIFEDVIGAKDVAKAYASLDLGRRRTIVDALMIITVNPVGRATGPKFDPDRIVNGKRAVDVTWKKDL